MFISDGLGPSIFCRKMEKARLMRQEMDGKSCSFPARVGTLAFDAILFDSIFPYLYFDLACKQLCFPPGKSINRETKVQSQNFGELLRTLDNLFRAFQELFIIFQEHFRTYSKLLRTALNLLQNKCLRYLTSPHLISM